MKCLEQLISKRNSLLVSSRWKIKAFKNINDVGIKLDLLNDVSNSLCKMIDSCAILHNSKLYVRHRSTFSEIIGSIQAEFDELNADTQIYNQCLDLLYLRSYIDDVDDTNSPLLLTKHIGLRAAALAELTAPCSSEQQERSYFLRSLINEFELRHFMNNKSKQSLINLSVKESILLEQLSRAQQSSKTAINLTLEDMKSFEVPPDAYIQHMSQMDRFKNSITLNLPSSAQTFLLRNCSDPLIRSRIFEDFVQQGAESESIIDQLRQVRQEKASLLGFQDFQALQFALNSRFFKSKENPPTQTMKHPLEERIFIHQVLNTSLTKVHEVLDNLLSDAQFVENIKEKAHFNSIGMFPSQIPVKKQRITYSDLVYLRQKVLSTPLFKFTVTWKEALQIINACSSQFLNVEFKEIPSENNSFFKSFLNDILVDKEATKELPLEKNIKCFEVIDISSQEKKGVVFLDLNAYEHATTCFSRGFCEIGSFQQLPCLLVRLNFKVTDVDDGTQMTLDNLQTLMHELGHVLHTFLNRQRFQLVANNFKLDYAEISAKIFENLLFLLPESSDKNQQLPSLLLNPEFQKFAALFRSIAQLEQIYYAKLDLFLWHRPSNESWSLKSYNHSLSQIVFRDLLDNHETRWYCDLSHLQEYSGLYFAYAFGEQVFLEIQDEFKENQLRAKSFITRLFESAHDYPSQITIG